MINELPVKIYDFLKNLNLNLNGGACVPSKAWQDPPLVRIFVKILLAF